MQKANRLFTPLLTFFLGIIATYVVSSVNAHGGNTNLIHACVRTTGGAIRIVGVNDTCNSNETPLDWSQNGIGTFGGFTTNQLVGYHSGGESLDYRLFDGVNFTNADFSGASMRFASFVNGNFQGARFLTATADGADFSSTNFSNVIIETTSLVDTNFSGTNFTAATFAGPTVVRNTNFTNANFTNAALTGGPGLGVNFSNSTRTGVIWSNTTCSDGTNSNNNGNTCEGHLIP